MFVFPSAGLHVKILAGSVLPRPLAEPLLTGLEKLEVKQTSDSRSGFSMSFAVGRSRPQDLLDYPGFQAAQLRANSRVIVTVAFGPFPEVLIDGYITRVGFKLGSQPGTAKIEVTGQDVSLMLERDETPRAYPQSDDAMAATQVILKHKLEPRIPTRLPSRPPSVIERLPVAPDNELQYLERLAARNGFVFYVIPGPVPGFNTGYWGPPVRGRIQPAITSNMGESTNVKDLDFTQDSEASTFYEALVDDPDTCMALPVRSMASLRIPLVPNPLWLGSPAHQRRRRLRAHGAGAIDMMARAQAKLDASTDEAVVARGSLDAGRYGHILRPRGLVGLRGAGYTHDGLYYVREVSHTITQKSYEQAFVLTREGTGALTPVVPV